MKFKRLTKGLGKLISAITGKPTTTASVAGEVANVLAKRTGAVNPDVAEATAEHIVRGIKKKS